MLACAEPGAVYERLAADLGVTTMTVGAWRKRFTQARCDGLVDGHRSGRPKAELVLTDAEPAQLRLSPIARCRTCDCGIRALFRMLIPAERVGSPFRRCALLSVGAYMASQRHVPA